MTTGIDIYPLTLDHLDEVVDFWRLASPLHPVSPAMVRGRLLAPPGGDPALLLAARDQEGRLTGVAAGVAQEGFERFAGVRWLAVAADADTRGVAGALLEALLPRLAACGVEKVRMLATPPYYFRPGIDTRETGLIAALLELGWTHEATYFNMSLPLDAWTNPDEEAIFGTDARGYGVRRARPEDREAFAEYMDRHWTPTWRAEAMQAFEVEPIPLFLAERGEEIAGFAAHEVSQCLGGFGPTGVTPEHRGGALGRRLLWACLWDQKRAGREVCEIGWVGPVPFYHRACGARIGPAYWMLSRTV